MGSNRMLMGAAIIGCLTAAMSQGAYAQEASTTNQLNVRAGQQSAAGVRSNASIREGRGADMNASLNARGNGQFERHAATTERRADASMREGRGYAERRGMRDERRSYARVGVEGGYRGYRGEHVGYRDRTVDARVGVTGGDYGYRTRRIYAYAPRYAASYATGPGYATSSGYAYAPGYTASVGAAPYYAPGWNVAYAAPYYDYGPGAGIGIGIGPIGIGIGPGWGW